MLKGSCLCGGVQYQYNGEITELAVCHCYQCKRAQGTPFVTNAPVKAALFTLLQGKELLTSYESSPNKLRVFCSHCGSPMYSHLTTRPDTLRLRAGTITEGHIPEPDYQIFMESKSEWCVLSDDKPTYAQGKK